MDDTQVLEIAGGDLVMQDRWFEAWTQHLWPGRVLWQPAKGMFTHYDRWPDLRHYTSNTIASTRVRDLMTIEHWWREVDIPDPDLVLPEGF